MRSPACLFCLFWPPRKGLGRCDGRLDIRGADDVEDDDIEAAGEGRRRYGVLVEQIILGQEVQAGQVP